MQIEIIEPCGIHGEIVDKGEIVEVDNPTGKVLIGMGKAALYLDDAPSAPTIQTQDPTPQTRDPQTAKS